MMERNLALAASTRCSARTTYRRTVPSTSVGCDEPVSPQHARREREGGNGRSPAWAPAAGRGRPPPGRAPGPGRPGAGGEPRGGFPESPTQRRSPGLVPSPLVGLSPTHPGGSCVPWTGDAEAGARSPHGSWALGEMRPAEPVPIASHVLCPVSCVLRPGLGPWRGRRGGRRLQGREAALLWVQPPPPPPNPRKPSCCCLL